MTFAVVRRAIPPRLVVGVCALALAAGAALPGALSAASTHAVAVKDDFFSPARLSVHKGDRVTWRWRGDSAHNVVGDGWSSPTMRRGAYSRTFRRAGTYRYVCTLHRRMGGWIIVG